jgi:tRNA pseudouridine38-40 synthase
MQNFKLLIEYDGTDYCGWQRQSSDRTIQGTIEAALNTMTKQSVVLMGSGRTDAGVHAVGQVANFRVDTRLTSEVFLRGLNSLLPPDIVIKECSPVHEDFHARYDAGSKVYDYRILNRTIRSALYRQHAWYIVSPLDLEVMRTAMAYLNGEHDFSAFQAAGGNQVHAVRRVMSLRLLEKDAADYVVFRIEANGFLRHMVRNIVGTLVDVGLGKTSPAGFEEILLSRDRAKAGITAPAQGLFLMEVRY